MLDVDRNFIHESFTNGVIGVGYSTKIDLSKINTSLLWEFPEYEKLVENLLFDVVDKESFSSTCEQAIFNLFRLKNTDDRKKKAKSLIIKLTQKYAQNDKVLLILIETIYNNYNDWIIPYYREFLLLRKDIEITQKIDFDRSASTSGSWVPAYQRRIDFYQSIINMISTLPDILDYAEHIAHFEKLIAW